MDWTFLTQRFRLVAISRRLASLAVFSLCVFAISPTSANTGPDEDSEQSSKYRIQEVTDDIYRFTAAHYHSVFVTTQEGIVVTDPVNTEAARWLKKQLDERFSAPVRYVIYSHSHTDHVYGGEVFDGPETTFISHRRARADLKRTEANTKLPDLVFEEEMILKLGNHSLRLTYHGPNNGRGSISMLFEQADLLFVVDWIVVGRLPYKDLPGYDLVGMIESTREILDMEFDTFVGGHAEIGDREDVRRYLDYLRKLYRGVLRGIKSGESLDQIQKDLELESFSDWARYDEWRSLNIQGTYEMLRDDDYLLRRPDVPSP
jgi:glyoxylase-like metal-dependent hydrolase (beta-lactamase superfamily II)